MRFALLGGLLLITACASEPTAAPSVATSIQVVSGADQVGTAGYRLANPIAVEVRDANGQPVEGVTVTFAINDELALAEPTTAVTNEAGIATTAWRLGAPGTAQLSASFDGSVPSVQVTATSESRPMRAVGGTPYTMCGIAETGVLGCWQSPRIGRENPAQGWTGVAPDLRFRALATGNFYDGTPGDLATYTLCATTEGGRVWCGHVAHDASVTSFAEVPGDYPALRSISGQSADARSPAWCALTASGEAWCWGLNSRGGVGDGTTTPRTSPVRVATDTRFASIVTGNSTCGLSVEGKAWCWGSNARGLTGQPPTSTGILAPAAVPTDAAFQSIVLGESLSLACGVRQLGGLVCWGAANGFPGTILIPGPFSLPALVPGMEGVTTVVATASIMVAFDADRVGRIWGDLYPLGHAKYSEVPGRFARPLLMREVVSKASWYLHCGRYFTSEAVVCMPLLRALVARAQGDYPGYPPAVLGVPAS